MTHVFLTGSSGTIGSALVPRLLADPAQQVTLLLRAGRHGDLSARLSGLRADWGLADGDPRLQRLHTVQGDIAQPMPKRRIAGRIGYQLSDSYSCDKRCNIWSDVWIALELIS